ncbi:unnamed protein product [Closterium sp. Naga37s-1]|nr:unnamed protein product [Closterium sp. Naga37s-1]
MGTRTTAATVTGRNAAATCDASSLADYTSSVQLSSDMTLHWKTASATKVNLALEAAAGSTAAAGWFSLAWSADGRMAPADAVIGNLPGGAVAAYYMSGYAMSDVQPTSSFDIGNAVQTTSASGSTVIEFSRMTGDGAVPVNVGGSNTLIWAFSEGDSQTLGFHGENDGVTTVDFSCDGSSSSAPPSTSPPSSPAPPSTSPPSSPAPPSTSPPSTSPPSSSSCAASSLAGYTYSAPLDSSLSLHWYTVSATKVNLALEAAAGSMAAAGWFSLAWSADGRMAPADAVIGNLPGGAVAAYYMGGYGLGDVQPTSGFSIGSGAALSTSASEC